jgi:S-adenosylmethionine synthetase
MAGHFTFTSEAGLRGHPDNVADQIGDAVLDHCLRIDPYARIGCNVMVTTDFVLVGGQIRSTCQPNIEKIVRDTIEDIGYVQPDRGFDYSSCEVRVQIDPQARTISGAVGSGAAGDSGIMFGYACNHTPELMPVPTSVAHRVAAALNDFCKSEAGRGVGPDGKVQVSVDYNNGFPEYINNFVISVQHEPEFDNEEYLREVLGNQIVSTVVPRRFVSADTRLHIKPTLGFVVGGPKSDCGLSGRKVVADTYGGWARHGGGGLSGKDPTKIDRFGSYMARYIAKNLVAAEIADQCEIQLAYMFGAETPVSVFVDFHGTGKIDEEEAVEIIKQVFPLAPAAIIETLNLRRPIYQKAGRHGHFGNVDDDFTWEKTDRVRDLLSLI